MKEMKKLVIITRIFFSDETTGINMSNFENARKALKKGHELVGIVTTEEKKILRTSPIVSIETYGIETENSFYEFA